jgi:hypothetical protein
MIERNNSGFRCAPTTQIIKELGEGGILLLALGASRCG